MRDVAVIGVGMQKWGELWEAKMDFQLQFHEAQLLWKTNEQSAAKVVMENLCEKIKLSSQGQENKST